MPTLVFTNTKHRTEATFRNDSSFVTIQINPDVKPKHPTTEEIHNDDLFDGKDCTITASKYFTVEFICPYEMDLYPFDIQKCFASFEPKANSEYFLEIIPIGRPIYKGPASIMNYVVTEIVYQKV